MEATNKFNLLDNVTAYSIPDTIYVVVGILLEINVEKYRYVISPINNYLIRIEVIEEVLDKVSNGVC